MGDASKWVSGAGALIALYLVVANADNFNKIATGLAQGSVSLITTLQGR